MNQVTVPVLEIGGTHVTAGLVFVDGETYRIGELRRFPVTADAAAEVAA